MSGTENRPNGPEFHFPSAFGAMIVAQMLSWAVTAINMTLGLFWVVVAAVITVAIVVYCKRNLKDWWKPPFYGPAFGFGFGCFVASMNVWGTSIPLSAAFLSVGIAIMAAYAISIYNRRYRKNLAAEI